MWRSRDSEALLLLLAWLVTPQVLHALGCADLFLMWRGWAVAYRQDSRKPKPNPLPLTQTLVPTESCKPKLKSYSLNLIQRNILQAQNPYPERGWGGRGGGECGGVRKVGGGGGGGGGAGGGVWRWGWGGRVVAYRQESRKPHPLP